MCGIAGIVAQNRSMAELNQAIDAMNEQIVHRGPDDAGKYCEPGVAIGMRRLSIIDVSGGQQPISNEDGTVHVVCNGEIYNFAALRRSLVGEGHRFSTSSDSEVIVHLYEEYGIDFASHLRGMFGFALWDSSKRRLIVGRDRLGKKPLFFSQQNGEFSFASEMKSLLSLSSELSAPNYAALGSFFQFGYVSQPSTIYSGIERLNAAHIGILENGVFRQQQYWNPSFEIDHSRSEEDWIDAVDEKLKEAVKLRLQSEVPLGVFLSGGLDSSAVVAYAHAAGLDPLKTFTIGFDRQEWDESEDAAVISRHFSTQHHRLQLNENELADSFPDILDAITRHCDEPFGDASAIPTYHVSRMAREHVTVILSGDGGDELFAGYNSYRGAQFATRYRKLMPSFAQAYLPSLIGGLSGAFPRSTRYKLQRVAKVLEDSRLPIIDAYRRKTSIWRPEQLQQLLDGEVYQQLDHVGGQYLRNELWDILQSDTELVSRLTQVDMQSYMLDGILVKVDRMSMAHSLEVRSPLLDHELVELAARMPTSMKIRQGQGKYILRKALGKSLPRTALRKGKQGFSVPLRDWFRGRLKGYLHDTLTSVLPQDIFQPATVSRMLQEHDSGKCDHSNRLWLLLVFAAWHRQTQTRIGADSGLQLAALSGGAT